MNTSNSAELFKQLAFVIPMRVDSTDRLWNLNASLRFLTRRMPGAEVVVVEEASVSKLKDLLAAFPDVVHIAYPNDDWFRRADGINAGAMATSRKYVCMYDTDVLVSPEAIAQGLVAMEQDGWRVVLPFNHICLDVRGALRERLGTSLDIAGYDAVHSLDGAGKMDDLSPRFVEGGICMVHRDTFLAAGGLNRKMISYGWEDTELHRRFAKLGYPILHLKDFSLIHLDHSRGTDSKPNEHYDANRQEYLKVKAMTAGEVARYVETDLSITARGQPLLLAALRKAHRRYDPLGLQGIKAFWSLLVIQVRARGLSGLMGRLAQRLPSARLWSRRKSSPG